MGTTATFLVCLAVAVVGAFLAILVGARRERKKIRDVFGGRPSLDERTFYERYFASLGVSAEVAIAVRRIIAEILGEDVSRLCDTDSFGTNIKFFFEWDSLADVHLLFSLEDKFQIKISDEEVQQLSTIRDIILLVDRKVKSNGVRSGHLRE